MDKQGHNGDWVDRYVRNELSEAEELEFETALLDSPELQDELEAALGLREAVRLEQESEPSASDEMAESLKGRNNWQPFAMAASVLLAVFSTVMFWKTSNDAAGLRAQIEALGQPYDSVLTVPVRIMRSSGSETPDVIVRRPEGKALVVLEIEATSAVSGLDQVSLGWRDQDENLIQSWSAKVSAGNQIVTGVNAGDLPGGLVWLEISDAEKVLDRRLIEFR